MLAGSQVSDGTRPGVPTSLIYQFRFTIKEIYLEGQVIHHFGIGGQYAPLLL
jgi:hypothetical protein